MPTVRLAGDYVRWTWLRAFLHRGWWLVTSVYLVVDARLSPAQLVTIGVAQGVVGLLGEVPAGVLADTLSRRWSLVVSHLLMGTAMVCTGLVASFAALVATQMLWGLAWTFASGADVALVTDELDDPLAVPAVLVRAARAQLTGAASGIVTLGAAAWWVGRPETMVTAGLAMLLLIGYVAIRFRERRFVPTQRRRWSRSASIFRGGLAVVRRSREVLVVLVATFLVNGAADASGRLLPKRLVDIGLPASIDPVVWLAGLGVTTLGLGAVALRLAEARLANVAVARPAYAIACGVGAVGLLLFTVAPDQVTASAAILLFRGLAEPFSRTIATLWVNARTSADVRATVHSFLAQAEYLGEITCGLGLAVLAGAAGLSAVLACCAVLYAVAAVGVATSAADREAKAVRSSAAR